MRSPAINCYRAILAQVNQLDSIYRPSGYIKELYMELTELAYYLLEEDEERACKGIEQIHETISELDFYTSTNRETKDMVLSITEEIRTHLTYLNIQLNESLNVTTHA